MKRGCPSHPKVADLAARLNVPKYSAVGILEMLWHFTAQYALSGDIGRFTDESIAAALCYDGDSSILVQCLVDSKWIDRCACHRLRVHDWKDHADQTVERVLAKRNQGFISCYDDPSMVLAPSKMPLPLPLPLPSLERDSADAGIPTWKEVQTEASMRAITPETAKSFFDHHQDNNLWLNGHKVLINWRSKLRNWQVKDRVFSPKKCDETPNDDWRKHIKMGATLD